MRASDLASAPYRDPFRWRRWTGLGAAILLLLSLVVLGILHSLGQDEPDPRILLIGSADSSRLAAGAVVASAVLTAVMLLAVPARGGWLWVFVPLRVAAILVAGLAVVVAPVVVSASTVPLVSEGCRTGYVVVEQQGWTDADSAFVHVDGLLGTVVARVSTPDSAPPFAADRYVARTDGDVIRVWRASDSAFGVDTGREPAAVLPVIDGLPRECGLTGGSLAVPPALAPAHAAPPPPPTAAQVAAEVSRMTARTLSAAVEPVTDETGVPPAAPAAETLSCGTEGMGVGLVLRTGDNAASLTRILAAWDAEGYLPDRAMGEDLRYREDGPVRLRIRDASSVDGLLHVSIAASCSGVAG